MPEKGNSYPRYIVLQYGTKEPVGVEDEESFYTQIFSGEFGMPASPDPESLDAGGKETGAPSQAAKAAGSKPPVGLSGLIKNEEDLDFVYNAILNFNDLSKE